MCKHGLCCRPVSVCLSVTLMDCIQMAEDIIKLICRPSSTGGGDGRGHIVSPRAQLVIKMFMNYLRVVSFHILNCCCMHIACYCRESVESCGSREIAEETGLKLKNVKSECLLNVIWPREQRHFVAVVLCGEVDITYQKEPDTLEPQKCDGIAYMLLSFACDSMNN